MVGVSFNLLGDLSANTLGMEIYLLGSKKIFFRWSDQLMDMNMTMGMGMAGENKTFLDDYTGFIDSDGEIFYTTDNDKLYVLEGVV